jgi:hypothetical protein
MKKHILYLILLITFSLQSFGQSVQYQGTVYSKVMTRGIYGADSGLVITPSDTFNKSLPAGTIRFLTDFSEFVWTGTYWKYVNAPSLTAYMRYVDSAAMLLPYARKSLLIDTAAAIQGRINAKQATLVSGTNIKTINGTSLLGSGNISISGGGVETDTTFLRADINARVKYTDTPTMLSPYATDAQLADSAAALRTLANTKQNSLSGTGFVKASGSTISYDNSTYLTSYTETDPLAVKLADSGTRYSTIKRVVDSSAAIRSAIPSVTGKVNISDTAAMLANYAKIQRLLDSALAIQSRLNLKLNIANPTATGTLTAPAITISSLTAGSASDSVVTVNATTGVLYRRAFPSVGGVPSGWGTTGTSGTNPSSNFVGTTDAVDFVGRANNVPLLRLTSGTSVVLGEFGSMTGASNVGLGYQTAINGSSCFALGTVASANGNSSFSFGFLASSNTAHGMHFNCSGSSASHTVNNQAKFTVTNGLVVESTTSGFLPPRMTTTQRDAIASPAAGFIIYNTTANKHQGYNGSTWNDFY